MQRQLHCLGAVVIEHPATCVVSYPTRSAAITAWAKLAPAERAERVLKLHGVRMRALIWGTDGSSSAANVPRLKIAHAVKFPDPVDLTFDVGAAL